MSTNLIILLEWILRGITINIYTRKSKTLKVFFCHIYGAWHMIPRLIYGGTQIGFCYFPWYSTVWKVESAEKVLVFLRSERANFITGRVCEIDLLPPVVCVHFYSFSQNMIFTFSYEFSRNKFLLHNITYHISYIIYIIPETRIKNSWFLGDLGIIMHEVW